MIYTLGAIAAAIGASASLPGQTVSGWSIDSRTLTPGDLFFALRGPHHDGHDYVQQVLARGAAGAVVETPGDDPRLLVVPDSLKALQSAAAWVRSDWNGTVVGVTGSAGKTTTKDVIADFLATEYAVGRTTGNYNNHIGMPLSLLRALTPEAKFAVLELGMNHAGEIRDLARLARPQVGVVTNVGYAHIENFDSIDGIAAAKRELIEMLPAEGLAVLNADDPYVARFRDAFAGRSVTFGLSEAADVRASDVQFCPDGARFRVDGSLFESAMPGRPGVLNILAGIAVAREFGVSLERLREGASTLHAGKMRGEQSVRDGVTIYNDCYNSNPDAAKAMLDVLRDVPAARRIAVLGEMLELGRWAEPLHREIGTYAATSGISVLVGIRGAARHMVEAAMEAGLDKRAAYFFDDPAQAGLLVRTLARPGDAILWKGSRGTRVERALESYLS